MTADTMAPTQETDASTPTEETPVTVSLAAKDLGRILHNASLFVTKDDTRTTLQCVRIVITNGTITTTATDSYSLAEDSAQLAYRDGTFGKVAHRYEKVSWSGGILASELAPIIKALTAKNPLRDRKVSLSLKSQSVTVEHRGNAYTVPVHDVGATMFPRTDMLWLSDNDVSLDGGCIGLAPVRLAPFGNLILADGERMPKPSRKDPDPRGTGLMFRFHGDTRPVTLTVADGLAPTFRALVMPIKPDLLTDYPP